MTDKQQIVLSFSTNNANPEAEHDFFALIDIVDGVYYITATQWSGTNRPQASMWQKVIRDARTSDPLTKMLRPIVPGGKLPNGERGSWHCYLQPLVTAHAAAVAEGRTDAAPSNA